MANYFVTATDTDAGKTFIASAVLYKLSKSSTTAAFKPISAGCSYSNGQLINEDAILLHHYANTHQTISSVNPVTFEEPIAPHIAANSLNQPININQLVDHFNKNIPQADFVITEGAGGWRLPLGNGEYLSQLAVATQQQIILVINMKLGCLNHAMLTVEAIKHDGLTIAGWIANSIEDMPYLSENIDTLKQSITAPCLGIVPKTSTIEQAANYINLSALI